MGTDYTKFWHPDRKPHDEELDDYECGYGKFRGVPPPRFQCEGIRRCGVRCRKWKIKGERFCQIHGKGLGYKHRKEVRDLPRLFKYTLGETLRDKVSQVMGEDPREALNLFEELALMRVSAGEAVKLYEGALKLDEKTDTVTKEKADELKQFASSLMVSALQQVQQMCEAAARVESQGKDKYSIHSLKAIIDQIILISYRVFKKHPDLVLDFERAIREDIRMPNEATGTDITPDQDVMDMDATVPKEPGDDDGESA